MICYIVKIIETELEKWLSEPREGGKSLVNGYWIQYHFYVHLMGKTEPRK